MIETSKSLLRADAVAPRGRALARSRSAAAKWLFLAPALIYVAAFFVYPLGRNVAISFQDYTATSFFTGEAKWVGLDNYLWAFRSPALVHTLGVTAIFTLGSIVPQFCLGFALALFFQRHFPLNTLLRTLLLLPWLVPMVVSGTILRWIFDQDYGVLNQALMQTHLRELPVPWLTTLDMALPTVIIANVWVGLPFNLVLLYSGLQEVPSELHEAAQVDGARAWRRFRDITVPLMRPVIAITLMLGLLGTIRAFDVIMALTQGGPANATQTLAVWTYFTSFQQLTFGRGAALSDILIAIALVFAAVYLWSARETLRAEAA
jgi:multiple sugar transport system permease protein